MTFKNLRFYSIDTSEINTVLSDEERLDDVLASAAFKPCDKDKISSIGIVPVWETYRPLHFSSGKNFIFRVAEESKILPSAVIKREVKKAVTQKEDELVRFLKKEEKDAIKAAVCNRLLSQALTSYKEYTVWLNPELSLVAVNTTSAKKAENALAVLRSAFSTFPSQILSAKTYPEQVMTEWLKNPVSMPDFFTLGSNVTLKSLDEDGATIKATKEDLTSDEIQNHLETKIVEEIALQYEDKAEIKLSADLVIKSLKFDDIYLERSLPEKGTDPVAVEQSMLVIETDLLSELCPKILKTFNC